MRRLMVVAGLAGLLGAAATAGASPNAANVRVDFQHSNCLQVPGLRQVRFFVELINTGDSAGALRSDIHFVWSGITGGWKEALNLLKGGQLRVGPHSRKLYYIELRTAPSPPITACGLRIGGLPAVHRIQVLVPRSR